MLSLKTLFQYMAVSIWQFVDLARILGYTKMYEVWPCYKLWSNSMLSTFFTAQHFIVRALYILSVSKICYSKAESQCWLLTCQADCIQMSRVNRKALFSIPSQPKRKLCSLFGWRQRKRKKCHGMWLRLLDTVTLIMGFIQRSRGCNISNTSSSQCVHFNKIHDWSAEQKYVIKC